MAACQEKTTAAFSRRCRFLLLTEGHAVGALLLSGVRLMGTHQDAIQRAVVCLVAVMCTLGNGALDALIGITVHNALPPSFDFEASMRMLSKLIP